MKPPLDGPLDLVSGQPDDGRMDARVTKLEADVTTIKIDVAVIKANGASKSDVAELNAKLDALSARVEMQIAKGHTRIILWVGSFIFLAQLLPMLKNVVDDPPAVRARTSQAVPSPAPQFSLTPAPSARRR